MKKLFTLFCMTLVFSVVTFGQTVHQYTAAEMNNLVHDLRGTGTATIVDGDTVELVSSGGIYTIDSLNIEISVDLTIRAASTVDKMPVVTRALFDRDGDTKDDGPDAFVKLKGDVDVVIDGISFLGNTDIKVTKYAIKSQKWTDFGYPSSDGYEAFIDSIGTGYAEDKPLQSFNLTVRNCKIDKILKGSEGYGIIIYPGMTAGLLKVENTTFSNLTREALKLALDSGERGARSWSLADSIALINCTFHHIGREALLTRAENAVQDSMNITYIDHCTFDSCGINGAGDSDRALGVEYNIVTIKNSVLSNDITTGAGSYAIRLRNAKSTADYMGYYNIEAEDTINASGSLGTNITAVAPGAALYADAANGDFTLASGSPFLGKASDGEVLGDMRWAADYVADNNAYLSSITVDGAALTDFDMYKYDFRVEIPFNDGVVPTVVGTAVNGSTPVVQDATALPGKTSLTVTAKDGTTTRTYEVFIVEKDKVNAIDKTNLDVRNIYPNPSNGSFTIANYAGANVLVYSITGKVVYQVNNIENNHLINTNLSKGMYFVSVQLNNEQSVGKIIVE